MCVCVCCLLCWLFPLCPSPWIFKRSRNGQNGCDLHRCCVKDQHCSSVGSFCQPCLTAMAPHKGIGETILQIIMSHQISSKHINHKSKKRKRNIFALSQPQLLTSLPWHWVKIPKTKYSSFVFLVPSRKSNNHRAEAIQCFLQSPICVLCSPEDSQPIRDPRFPSLQHCCMFMMFFQFVSLFLSSIFTFLCFCVSFCSYLLGHMFFPHVFFSHFNHLNLLWHLQLRGELRVFIHQHFPFSRCTRLKEVHRAARSHLPKPKKRCFHK